MSLHHKHLKEALTSQGTPFSRNHIKYLPTFLWADFIGLGIFIPGISYLYIYFGSTGSVPFFARCLLNLSPHATLLSHNHPTGTSSSQQLHLFVCAIRCPTLIYQHSTLFCIYIVTMLIYKNYIFEMITIGKGESVAYYVELRVLRLLAKTTPKSGSKPPNRSRRLL
jgi:hypothetical protein